MGSSIFAHYLHLLCLGDAVSADARPFTDSLRGQNRLFLFPCSSFHATFHCEVVSCKTYFISSSVVKSVMSVTSVGLNFHLSAGKVWVKCGIVAIKWSFICLVTRPIFSSSILGYITHIEMHTGMYWRFRMFYLNWFQVEQKISLVSPVRVTALRAHILQGLESNTYNVPPR